MAGAQAHREGTPRAGDEKIEKEQTAISPFASPARFAAKRLTILRAIGRRWHRYRLFRGLTMTLTLGLLAGVPLSGLARFDLFGDSDMALFREADALHAFIAVAVAIFSFYLFTFLINLVAGRMFCGWGCPVGQLNRLTDTYLAQKKDRLLWGSILGLFAILLSGSILLWWSTPSVFFDGTRSLPAWGALALLTGLALAFARVFGWSFCRKACPIGLYYSVVQQKRPLGILFDRPSCQDEGACVRACPVMLDPRDLGRRKDDIGGLAIDGLTENSHCLRCGACVEACELVTSKLGPVALAFGKPDLAPGTQDIGPAGAGDLVQLQIRPKRPAPKLEAVPEPATADEDEDEPAVDLTAWLLTRGGRGLFGTGLAPITALIALLFSGGVFALVDGPLWLQPTGTSSLLRFAAAFGSLVPLTLVGLLLHRRLGVGRFLQALAVLSIGALLLLSMLFVALTPGSASRYAPKQTWEEEEPVEAEQRGYVAASAGFAAARLHGRVTRDGRPVPGAVVYIEAPRPGRSLDERRTVEVFIDAGAFSSPLLVAREGDRIRLANRDEALHTGHLSADRRSLWNIPLAPGMRPRSFAAPGAGEYRMTCDNHEGEESCLLVLDHPYVTRTDAEGRFILDRAPVGETTIVARDGFGRVATPVLLGAPESPAVELRIEAPN